MTTLLVDAGNSRLKYAELDAAGNICAQAALAYAGRPVLDAFVSLLDAFPQLQRITLVHVLARPFDEAVQAVCHQRGIPLHSVRPQKSAYGIVSGYQMPAALGADRFVGLVAARQVAEGRACLVIDCGTAVTVDALDAHGLHLGGLILPGLQLSAEALLARTQNRMSCSFDEPVVFAPNTGQAVGGGCLFGLAGAIEGICARMQEAMSEVPLRLLAGGDAERLHGYLPGSYHLEPDLLMRGLQWITEQETCTSC